MVGYIGPNGAGKSTTIKMLTGILVPTSRALRVAGLDPSRAAHRARPPDRRGVRPAHHAVVGPAAARHLRAAARRSTGSTRPATAPTSSEFVELLDLGDLLDTPVRQLSLGPADARRHHRRAAARPGDPLPRRAHHRPRRGEQGPAAGVPARPQRRARHHPDAHHPRPPGHRGALRPGDRHRPRHARSSTAPSPPCTSSGGATRTLVVDLVDEAPPIEVPGAGCAGVEGPRQWLSLPGPRRSAAPIVAAVAARTTSPTCPSRSRTSRTSSATSTPGGLATRPAADRMPGCAPWSSMRSGAGPRSARCRSDGPAGGVVVRVMATGMCRSDWHAWAGHDEIAFPHVPGHELAGEVVEVGAGVDRWAVGDRVTVPFVCGCGRCEWCLAGNAQVCPDQQQPGFTHWGSFAEYVALHAADTNLVAFPSRVDFATAASLGCRFATAYRALVGRARITEGEWVTVVGAGGVGLSTVMIARALGCPGGRGGPQPRGARRWPPTSARSTRAARRRLGRPGRRRRPHGRRQPRRGGRRGQRADLRRRDPQPPPPRSPRAGGTAPADRWSPAGADGSGDRLGARPAGQPRDGRGRLPGHAGPRRAGPAPARAAGPAHHRARGGRRRSCPPSTGRPWPA